MSLASIRPAESGANMIAIMFPHSLGHEERFPPPRLSAGYRFGKETIAGMRRNGRDAPPIAAIPPTVIGTPGSGPKGSQFCRPLFGRSGSFMNRDSAYRRRADESSDCLFDHFVGIAKERWRHGDAERLRGL